MSPRPGVFIHPQPALDPDRLVFTGGTRAAANMAALGSMDTRSAAAGAEPHGHWKLPTLMAGLLGAGIGAPCVFEEASNGRGLCVDACPGEGWVEPVPAPTWAPDLVLLDDRRNHKSAGLARADRRRGAACLSAALRPSLSPIEQVFARYALLARRQSARSAACGRPSARSPASSRQQNVVTSATTPATRPERKPLPQSFSTGSAPRFPASRYLLSKPPAKGMCYAACATGIGASPLSMSRYRNRRSFIS